MYSKRSGLILGFHGCDKSVAESVVGKNQISLKKSTNTYDWLGHGIYFWENDLKRALDFAIEQKESPKKDAKNTIKNPAAIGAIINLGNCLDLLDSNNFSIVRAGYDSLKASVENLPNNSGDHLRRNLDCEVIRSVHSLMDKLNKTPFDSIRAAFWEGEPIYGGADFREKNHIQICVINPNCIKGYFLPRDIDRDYINV